jgi:radical SAM protein with 4Fe4S-binding SPASM domain
MSNSCRNIRELVLDLTDCCPMRCLHCSAGSCPQLGTFVPYTKVMGIVQQAVLMGLETLSFSGGEPLIHPRLPQMIELAHSCGVRDIRIFTSGLAFGKSKLVAIEDDYAQSLADAGVTKIFFNLQGGCAKTQERITGTADSFQAVLTGSKACKEHGIYVGFHFVPMRPNWRELTEVFSVARELDIDEIGILRFVAQGRGKSNRSMLEMDTVEFHDFLCLTSALLKEYARPRLRLGCPFNSISEMVPRWEKKRCLAASEMCHVLADGTVAPCSAFKHEGEMKSGNVYSQRFQEIWRAGFPNFAVEQARLSDRYHCTAQHLRAMKCIEVAGLLGKIGGT